MKKPAKKNKNNKVENIHSSAFNWYIKDTIKIQAAVDFFNTLTPEQFELVKLYGSSRYMDAEDTYSDD